MKKRRKNTPLKLSLLFITVLFLLVSTSISYSLWYEDLYIQGTITTGTWDTACIRINKTLEGSFTDPYTGDDLTEPTNEILIANLTYPTKFKMTIAVENCGTTELTDVIVYDVIKNTIAPRSIEEPYKGDASFTPYGFDRPWNVFGFDDLVWEIDTLEPGEIAELVIWIETLANPSGKYEPTSGDEGDHQLVEFNDGATVEAEAECGSLTATTEGINENTGMVLIIDDGIPENGIGLIDTELPYSTSWAEDSCIS